MKIGLVQSRAERGDLSGNLRRIVQGVRACMDAGAQVALAGAAALDGVCYGKQPGSEESARLQARAALAALAEELSIPLIIASRAAEPGEAAEAALRPYLLCAGEVCELPNHAISRVGELALWVDVGEQALPPPPGTACDAALHLPTMRWRLGQDGAKTARAQAEAGGHAVLIAQSIGCCEGRLQAGGCAASAPDGHSVRLPDFTEGECVWHPEAKSEESPLATAAEAIIFLLREVLIQSGADGYGVAAESPTAPLLCTLVEQAVGRGRLFLRPGGRAQAARSTLQTRLRGARLTTWAEAHDCILLNPLTRNQLLLGDYTAPASLYGTLAPLADLWESELAELWRRMLPGGVPCPLAAADERLLRDLLTHSPLRYLNTPEESAALRLHRRLCQAPTHSLPLSCRMR